MTTFNLPWVDAKVAVELCVGGVCHYRIAEPSINNAWVTEHVTPNITQVYGPQVGAIFGRALLWLCFDDTRNRIEVPHAMWIQITQAHEVISTLQDGTNPIAKVLQVVNGRDAQVFMDSVQDIDVDGQNTRSTGRYAADSATNRQRGSCDDERVSWSAKSHGSYQ